jgi:hypothetical protein
LVNTFLKAPKETKLPKYEAIKQKKQIIDRQDKYIVHYPGPKGYWPIKEQMQNGLADGHDRVSRAGENKQNNEYLPGVLHLPSIA